MLPPHPGRPDNLCASAGVLLIVGKCCILYLKAYMDTAYSQARSPCQMGSPMFERSSCAQPILHTLQVFEQAGLKSPILGSIVIGLVNVSGTVVAALAMDRFGRKPLLLLSHFGMAVSLASISVAVHFICEWVLWALWPSVHLEGCS